MYRSRLLDLQRHSNANINPVVIAMAGAGGLNDLPSAAKRSFNAFLNGFA